MAGMVGPVLLRLVNNMTNVFVPTYEAMRLPSLIETRWSAIAAVEPNATAAILGAMCSFWRL